jgi:prefoldin subunit 5
MSVVTIYPNEALQYLEAFDHSLQYLNAELTALTDRAPTITETISDGDLFRIEQLEKNIRLIEKLIKQIEHNISTPAK